MGTHLFGGLIDQVQIYNTALSVSRLRDMSIGPLAGLEVSGNKADSLPEVLSIGARTTPIKQPLAGLAFSAVNGGGSITGIRVNFSDQVMIDNNDDGLGDLPATVSPSAIQLHGYINETSGPPDLT